MLTLTAPFWLFGLIAVPWLRWLHRSGPHLRGIAVSNLALWRGAAVSRSAAGKARPPDPAWRRRALLAALLMIALSGPRVLEQRPRITVWVDDSLSMLMRETSATRLAEGLSQVRSALEAAAPAQVEVRTLGDPWRNLGALTESTIATIVEGAGAGEPSAPPTALVTRESTHWLLSDGTDAALLDWTGGRGPDRVFQIATLMRNAGLERMSARRNLGDPERIDVLLKITNGGSAAETRTVVFVTDAGEAARSEQVIPPGTSALVNATTGATSRVRATLQPRDALAEDDTIEVPMDPLRRRRVAADPGCPRALVAAVRAHPALVLAAQPANGVDATIDCGTRAAASGVPALRVISDRMPEKSAGSLRWSSSAPSSVRIGLEGASPHVVGRLEPRDGDSVLLAAGDVPLIVARAGEPLVIETVLDFGPTETARRPELPLLANFLFERLLGPGLLDGTARVDRGPNSANVVPIVRDRVADSGRAAHVDSRMRDAGPPLLVAALLVLAWEIVALGRQWHRLRDQRSVTAA